MSKRLRPGLWRILKARLALVRRLVSEPFGARRRQQVIDREGRITTDDSRLHAYVIPAEEELLIAQKVVQCLGGTV